MLQLKEICKSYYTGDLEQTALDRVSLDFRDHEFAAILGHSGSGKTTLLNIIGGLDHYDTGDLIINGVSTEEYRDKDWDNYRNHSIGFVFQSYNLIPHQTVRANVELAMTLTGVSSSERKKRAVDALDAVGLKEHISKKPNQLSGGQMQRVAIARALVNDPDILLADEPTGALDSDTSIQVMEILKSVSKDRLVIMVTHNPELAEEYADRIIRLKDGQILSDTNPLTNTELMTEEDHQVHRSTRLRFFTALGLSFNNLIKKKGRTLLTAFAGAIGIIGIALILALSTGANAYIDDLEQNAMGSYPIEIERQTIDLTAMMESGRDDDNDPFASLSSSEETAKYAKIYSDNIVADTVKTTDEYIKTNNLTKFKKYIEDNADEVNKNVTAVEYQYAITPQVYRIEENSKDEVEKSSNDLKERELVQVSPATLDTGQTTGGMMPISGSTSSAWAELVDSEKLRDDQYTLLAGTWPEEADEVALIVTEKNKVSDFTLYTLGLLDIDDMNEMVENIKDEKNYEDDDHQFSYDEVLGLEYSVLAPYQLYKYESDDEAWIDKSDDDDYVEDQLSDGISVRITGVLQAKDSADISSGIGYTGTLTDALLERTADSEIVNQQLADPKTNVLTGKEFEDSEDDDNDGENKDDEDEDSSEATASANIDNAARSSSVRHSASPSENNRISLPFVTVVYAEDGSEEDTGSDSESESADESTDDGKNINIDENENAEEEYTVKFLNYDGSVLHEGTYKAGDMVELPSDDPAREATKNAKYVFLGWKSSATKGVYTSSEIPKVDCDDTYTAVFYESPIANNNSDNNNNGGTNAPGGTNTPGDGNMPDGTNNPGGTNMPNGTDMPSGTTMPGNSGIPNGTNMPSGTDMPDMSGMTGDMSGFSLSDDQLAVLLAQMSDDTPSTYEDVLTALGYTTLADPSKISLYPIDFGSKDNVQSLIDKYNDQAEKKADQVSYTDMIGILTSSLKSIINTIGYLLIAFVAISLIVSSIMIAIITYISVLERTKEIGILRALGASKRGVSRIFNAETFMEGLLSGVLGVITALLIMIPINRIVDTRFGYYGIASLPVQYSVGLVIISIILTLLAGFIPARIASRKDPVTALRTE